MRLLRMLGSLLLVAGCSASGERLECPVAHASGSVGIARETPAQIASVGARLAAGGENAITETAGAVPAHDAHASRAEIVNYLVTAYCPEIARKAGLDLAGKRAALRAFAARADRIVASAPVPRAQVSTNPAHHSKARQA